MINSSLLTDFDKYENILSKIIQWRTIGLQDLYLDSKFSGDYSTFTRVIARLEKEKLVSKRKGGRNNRVHITASSELLKVYELDKKIMMDGENIVHDTYTANIARALIASGFFKEVTLEHQFISDDVGTARPDAILKGVRKGIAFDAALEVELSVKSKDRIIEKFKYYGTTTKYQFALYVFKNLSSMEIYRKRLIETSSDGSSRALEKVMLMLCENPSEQQLSLLDAQVFFKDKYRIFKDYIEKAEQNSCKSTAKDTQEFCKTNFPPHPPSI